MENKNSICKEIILIDRTESTNDVAKKLALEGAIEGTVVTALSQTNGKGRLGRTWFSQKGDGLYMSVILRPEKSPILVNKITHLSGLGIAKAIAKITNLETFIKWPNDIILNGKKIAGILTEASTGSDIANFLILGIGVNLNHKTFPKDLDHKATSLFLETGQEFCREIVMDNVLKEIGTYYFKYMDNLDFSLYVDEYKKYLINLNKEVLLKENKMETKGIAMDITNEGQLVVLTLDGREIIVNSGEVSVSGVYGYL